MYSKKIRILINGFGRIGRSATRIILKDENLELVGINDLYSYEQMVYLLKYDSIYGMLEDDIRVKEERLFIDDKEIRLFSESDPDNMDMQALNVDVVLQCSGMFLTTESNLPLIRNGAGKVIISAPATDDTPTYIFGVNDKEYKQESVISNSSCSANAIVPIFKIIDKHFGINTAMMSMYHSYTSYQNLLDGKHYSKDIRRTRSATQNIIPLMSSAAEATASFFPYLEGKLYAKSIRVPVASNTLYDLTMHLRDTVTVEEVNRVCKEIIQKEYQGILDITKTAEDSLHYVQNPHSAVINTAMTQVAGDDLLKLFAWQDNEYAYAKRLVDMTAVFAQSIKA